MKKTFFTTIFIIFLCIISSCTTQKTLPDLTNMSRDEMKQILEGQKINYIFRFKTMVVTNNEYDKFIEYGNNLNAGDNIDSSKQVAVYTSPLNLTTNKAHLAEIDFDYAGKSFIDDGVGQVTLVRTVDGDTAHFKDLNGEIIKLRFLGINTPETMASNTQPWGKAASNYTSNLLLNAKTIVLEAEGNRKETYDRYLGWVWVDGKLINLYLVQEAFANCQISSSSKYFNIFTEITNEVIKTGRRVYGELDPNYQY